MAKTQAKQEPALEEETESWTGEEAGEFDEAANDSRGAAPARYRPDMRHRIEELIEARRLQRQIADYEFPDLDDAPRGRRSRNP